MTVGGSGICQPIWAGCAVLRSDMNGRLSPLPCYQEGEER
jgi:hypothetical protein